MDEPETRPFAANSDAVMRYTERPKRFFSIGQRSLPDVELSFGSTVNVHVPGGAMSGWVVSPLDENSDSVAGPAPWSTSDVDVGAKSPGATSRCPGGAACAATGRVKASRQSAQPDNRPAALDEGRAAWIITPPEDVVVCAVRWSAMRAGV